jgi:acylphosphatase
VALARTHVLIAGLVQGVAFRDSTRALAIERGVRGWVRNLVDGRVEAIFEGEREAVDALVAWCHRGPPGARVERVEIAWLPATREFLDFRVRPWGNAPWRPDGGEIPPSE